VYYQLRKMPTDGLEISVQGQKWYWSFTYKNGRKASNEFFVPVGQDVKLVMNSADVLHSFYIPAFRNKQDVVPGRYTALWFRAEKEGTYQVFCTEYCGDQHSGMQAKLHVVPREKYEEWLSNDPYKGLTPLQIGQKIHTAQCIACHNITGAPGGVGPTWKGSWGAKHVMEGGAEVVVDENYVRESIVNPQAKLVKGYPPVMPTFAGQLKDEEISGVIEYLKTLK
jgi:cytochrome c oxidase subunit 2